MLLKTYLIFLLIMSIISALVFWWDKHRSRREENTRIPEIVLLSFMSCGGSIGGLFGMYVLRHKTNFHTKFHFAITVWLAFSVQAAVGVFIYLIESGTISI